MAEEKKTTGAKKTTKTPAKKTTPKTTSTKTTKTTKTTTRTKKPTAKVAVEEPKTVETVVEETPVVETAPVEATPVETAPVEKEVAKDTTKKKSSWGLESPDRLLYFIFGATFLAITLICSIVYIASFAATVGKSADQYKVFTTMFMFFFIPSVLTSIVSVIFNTLSLKSSVRGLRIASIVLIGVNALLLLVNLVLSCVMLF